MHDGWLLLRNKTIGIRVMLLLIHSRMKRKTRMQWNLVAGMIIGRAPSVHNVRRRPRRRYSIGVRRQAVLGRGPLMIVFEAC